MSLLQITSIAERQTESGRTEGHGETQNGDQRQHRAEIEWKSNWICFHIFRMCYHRNHISLQLILQHTDSNTQFYLIFFLIFRRDQGLLHNPKGVGLQNNVNLRPWVAEPRRKLEYTAGRVIVIYYLQLMQLKSTLQFLPPRAPLLNGFWSTMTCPQRALFHRSVRWSFL